MLTTPDEEIGKRFHQTFDESYPTFLLLWKEMTRTVSLPQLSCLLLNKK